MRTIIIILLFPFLVLLMGASCQKEEVETQPREIHLTADQQLMLDEAADFPFALLRNIVAEAKDGENVFISPLSVSLALAMTYNGAAGDTRDAMRQTMQLPDLTDDQINKAWQQLVKDLLAADKKIDISIANSIWYLEGFHVQPPFIEINRKYYDAEVIELDFGRPDAVTIINKWVYDNTNRLIDKIIERVSRQTVMILINAIYFKGQWTYEFDKSKTQPMPFYLDDGEVKQAPMMHITESFNYLEEQTYRIAELPYGRGNYSMMLVLPNQGVAINDVLQTLDSGTLSSLGQTNSTKHKLDVQLPKFSFVFEQLLNDALIHMGMGVAFSPSLADFSGINPNEQLFISEVRHKAYVDVNEEGTEAAAVTAVIIERTSAGPDTPKAFYVNRPFLFFIRESVTGAILFAGQVNDPTLDSER
jgi:serine protease inhibitor